MTKVINKLGIVFTFLFTGYPLVEFGSLLEILMIDILFFFRSGDTDYKIVMHPVNHVS